MNYTINESEFKPLGYTFQKLYAMEYKTYRKEVNSCYTIWCWVKGKAIEINDFYGNTEKVIDYFLNNQDKAKYSKTFDYEYMPIYLNHKTGEIIDKSSAMKSIGDLDAWFDSKYITDNDWRDVCLPVKKFKEVIEEISKIKK